jgi:hypothetical protein
MPVPGLSISLNFIYKHMVWHTYTWHTYKWWQFWICQHGYQCICGHYAVDPGHTGNSTTVSNKRAVWAHYNSLLYCKTSKTPLHSLDFIQKSYQNMLIVLNIMQNILVLTHQAHTQALVLSTRLAAFTYNIGYMFSDVGRNLAVVAIFVLGVSLHSIFQGICMSS